MNAFKIWTNARTFKLLFTTCVRLEFSVPVWNSLRKKDVKKIEKVQQKARKIVPQRLRTTFKRLELLLNRVRDY